MEDTFPFLKKFLETEDLEDYLKRFDEDLKANPKKLLNDQLHAAQAAMVSFIHDLKFLNLYGQPMLHQVNNAYWEIALMALETSPAAYFALGPAEVPDARHDISWLRRANFAGMILTRKRASIDATVLFMREALEMYPRRLRHYVRLLRVIEGRSSNVEGLNSFGTADLERAIENNRFVTAAGLVLGDEYRRLRNSLAHGTYEIAGRPPRFTFRDSNRNKGSSWTLEQSYVEFAAAFRHFLTFFWALEWARVGETLAVAIALQMAEEDNAEGRGQQGPR